MKIVNITKEHIEASGLSFFFADHYESNEYDNENFPCGFLIAPLSADGKLLIGGNHHDTYTLNILIGDRTRLDFTMSDRMTIVDTMFGFMQKFIRLMNEDARIGLVTYYWIQAINEKDINIDGMLLTMKVELFDGDGCTN